MASGLYSGVSGLALGTGLYKGVSGLWSGASGLVTGYGGGSPYGGASLYLDFLTMTAPTFDSRITFSRGTNATLTDSTGKVTYAPANLLTYSQQFDNAAWGKAQVTVTADVTTAPDGTATADLFVPTTAAGNHQVTQTITTTPAAHAFSVYLKQGGYSWAALALTDSASGLQTTYFNLATGALGSVGTGVTATVTGVGDGWYRCTVRLASALAGSNTMRLYAATGNNALSFTGDGTSGIYIWGAQLEPVTYQTTPGTYQATTASAYYGPRFDYDPVTLAAKGLLIEEARTNLLTYSEQFDNAAWVKTDSTVTANATSSPDGTANADLVTEGSAGTAQIGQSATITAGAAITASVYLKRGNTDWMRIQIVNGVDFFRLWVNTATGAIGTTGAGGAGVYTSSSIRSAANGWYRVSITGTLPASPANIFLNTASADNSATRVSGGTYYSWGAQLEAGAFATSYIPTVASTVTRSADVATMTGTNFSSWYNQSAGTFVAEYDSVAATIGSSNKAIASANDNTGNNRVYGYLANTGAPTLLVTNGGATEATPLNSVIANATVAKSAWGYALNDFAIVTNGGAAATDATGTPPTAPNKLDIGNHLAAQQTNGHIRAIAYFNSRQANATLQTLTAPSTVPSLTLDFTSGSYSVGY